VPGMTLLPRLRTTPRRRRGRRREGASGRRRRHGVVESAGIGDGVEEAGVVAGEVGPEDGDGGVGVHRKRGEGGACLFVGAGLGDGRLPEGATIDVLDERGEVLRRRRAEPRPDAALQLDSELARVPGRAPELVADDAADDAVGADVGQLDDGPVERRLARVGERVRHQKIVFRQRRVLRTGS